MRIKVDCQPISLLGTREIQVRNQRGHLVPQTRYYYSHELYPALLLVTQGRTLDDLEGRLAIALFSTPDSRIVCDVVPNAPERWRDGVTQCTVKTVAKLPWSVTLMLTEALARKVQ